MSAVFTHAVRYEVEATCLTPLRTGAGETEDVLRDGNGRMFLQGSSIAGALRDWLEQQRGMDTASVLFGSPKSGAGSLMVSDGIFDPDALMVTRPRLRIDPATGSGAYGGKFDIAHVSTGARLHFTLTWLGREQNGEELARTEELLAALDQGAVRLGGQKSNGFGWVSLQVHKRSYDMKQEKDREDWLNDVFGGEPLILPELTQSGQVVFEVKARADRLLVRSGAFRQEQGKKASSYMPNLEESGKPVIPGSSVKGAVLHRVRGIAALMGLPAEVTDLAFGRGAAEGDNGLAGQFHFEDVYPEQVKKQKIARIRIDRFTGGVLGNGLFREEPLSGAVTLRITAPADQGAACGLLLYALRDLGLGLYNLGSDGAIGRGILEVREITAVSGTRSLALTFEGDKTSMTDRDGLWADWMQAMEEVRHDL